MDSPSNNPEKIVVGLDIGTTKIACFVGRRNEHGKIEILGYGKSESVGVSRGVVANIEKTVDSIRTAIEEAKRTSGTVFVDVNVGIAGQHIKSQQTRGQRTRDNLESEISQVDIEALIQDMYRQVMQPGEEILHVLPQEYTVDNEGGIKEPVGMSGIRLEANFHVIIGQIAAIRNINRCIEKAELNVDQLILEPLASSASVLSAEEQEAGVALVDIGGGTTDIAIFQDGIIRHTAVIPFGGNVLTEDIRQGCQIMKKQAELLKQRFGSAIATEMKDSEIVCIPGLQGRNPREISLKNLASIIEARMTEIIEHVHFEIRNSGFADQLIGGVVLTGGGSQLRHITQLFQYVTGMDCRVGYPSEHLAEAPNQEVTAPSFATGVGLVIKGFDRMASNGDATTDEAAGSERIGILERMRKYFVEDEEIQ